MLRTFLRLASQVKSRAQNEIGIRPSDLILQVESFQIHLRCSESLLSGGHSSAQFANLYIYIYQLNFWFTFFLILNRSLTLDKINVQQPLIRQGKLGTCCSVLLPELFPTLRQRFPGKQPVSTLRRRPEICSH